MSESIHVPVKQPNLTHDLGVQLHHRRSRPVNPNTVERTGDSQRPAGISFLDCAERSYPGVTEEDPQYNVCERCQT
jgi:hypothetical protein